MKPRIGITTGDPAGIGPEIAKAAFASPEVRKRCEPVLFGTTDPVSYMGKITAEGGRAAYEAIEKAVAAVRSGDIDAIATGPLNKESLKAAGVPYIGHTEILAGLTGTEDPLTMFETTGLRSFFLTRHVSLRQACDLVTEERVYNYLRRCDSALRKDLRIQNPSIAVAGLNPHCGEHGLFGTEEAYLYPAIEKARSDGINVFGPIGADSVFHQALTGTYTAVLSLYHDQGHIACKTLNFHKTVSITLGLPFLRTSVDHGTAFDIAGKGIANPTSMIEAVKTAAHYIQERLH